MGYKQWDVAVVGAGPAGLAFALATAEAGLSVLLLDQQPLSALAHPAPDGREIALTHVSRGRLAALGVWERIPASEVSPLVEARVFNGSSLRAFRVRAADAGVSAIGQLVPNHWLRRALYETLCARQAAEVVAEARVEEVWRDEGGVEVRLADGRRFRARLLVGADSRFSRVRTAVGITASTVDFGRSMMVLRMGHEAPHGQVAWEWFGYGGQTLALLPLRSNQSGVVVTLEPQEIARLMALDERTLAKELTERFENRLGRMWVSGPRFSYRLVAVYAHEFVGRRVALIGDAAVGMHPVTAHGFNFGLAGACTLAYTVAEAVRKGGDPGDRQVLVRYERIHRRRTWPLYQATNWVATLYARDSLPARALRSALLQVGSHQPWMSAAVAKWLSHTLPRHGVA